MKSCVLCGTSRQESESEEPYGLRCEKTVVDAVMHPFHELAEMG
jgi:hypothetical protein